MAMGHTVSVPTNGTKHLILQAYEAGGPYQWASEAVTNAIQAHATWVELSLCRRLLENMGIYKRIISDNGKGMNETELVEFMSSFGGGGRPISLGENFGQGVKSSTYPWNPFGLLVLSWTPETPEGRMIWIMQDPVTGDYGLKLHEFEDSDTGEIFSMEIVPLPDPDDPEVYIDPDLGFDLRDLHHPEIRKAGHGTVFMFLGKDMADNTEFDLSKEVNPPRRALALYLNQRFISVPKSVEIRSDSFEKASAKKRSSKEIGEGRFVTLPDTTEMDIHTRTISGASGFLPKGANLLDSGTTDPIDSHGTVIEWHLAMPGVTPPGDGSYGPGKPRIAVEYLTEFEGLTYSVAYDVTTNVNDYRIKFGVSSKEVMERLWLTIKPRSYTEGSSDWGVVPGASRNHLVGKGGTPLPMDGWGDRFFNDMPTSIADAILLSKITAIEPPDSLDIIRRIREMTTRLGSRMRPPRLILSPGGTPSAGAAVGTTGKPKRRIHRPKPTTPPVPRTPRPPSPTGLNGTIPVHTTGGSLPAKPSRRADSTPFPLWDRDPFLDDDHPSDCVLLAVKFVAKDSHTTASGESFDGIVYLNPGFHMFLTEIDHWQNEYPRASEAEITDLVHRVYGEEMVSRVKHILSEEGRLLGLGKTGEKVYADEAYMAAKLADIALTSSVQGLMNVESRITTVAGAKWGAKTSKPKTAKVP